MCVPPEESWLRPWFNQPFGEELSPYSSTVFFVFTAVIVIWVSSLRKQPFLLAPRRWGRFARRIVCDSATDDVKSIRNPVISADWTRTVENSPSASSVYIRLCKRRKKVFYCFYKITFPRKNAKLFVMALIKREILTSRKALPRSLAHVISSRFAKRLFLKYGLFSLKMSA